MALKWHPDRNLDKKAESEAKFKDINEAYEGIVMVFNNSICVRLLIHFVCYHFVSHQVTSYYSDS